MSRASGLLVAHVLTLFTLTTIWESGRIWHTMMLAAIAVGLPSALYSHMASQTALGKRPSQVSPHRIPIRVAHEIAELTLAVAIVMLLGWFSLWVGGLALLTYMSWAATDDIIRHRQRRREEEE